MWNSTFTSMIYKTITSFQIYNILSEISRLQKNNICMKANIILFAPSSTSFHDTITCCTGLIVMAFGPSFSYCLIRLLYGQKWSDGEASKALQLYCLYIVLLAMNGKVSYHKFVLLPRFLFLFFIHHYNCNYIQGLGFTITINKVLLMSTIIILLFAKQSHHCHYYCYGYYYNLLLSLN